MTQTDKLVTRLKQPEYTGENRCLPCTVVNSVIAVLLAAVTAAGVTQVLSVRAGSTVGAVVLSGSLLSIYFRGYLVPGTPELTKQYFPIWLLDLFGKAPETVSRTDEPTGETEIDPEQELLDLGALEPCKSGEDLCLTPEFRDRWYAEIDRVDTQDTTGRERLLSLLGLEDATVEFTEHGAAFQAFVDGTVVGRWESEAAFLADLGAAETFDSEHERWETLSVQARGQLLNGLRLFIDQCPSCGGTPTFGTDTVESCCSTHEVAAVACQQCDARLFESAV